ncbi:Ig-like domain-containing protein [uncultured Prevotella sp.]|uniref:Ig-like domain-containing protein n=1 Tax=uncultured Prevotella sp. TaxID=159272 RepID=UPI0025977FA9|nr:Ig-like domain-containing protein [uncultured Prevotella sp.]
MSRLLRNLMLLALIIIGGGMSAQADDVAYKTLDFATASYKGVSSYTDTWTAKSNEGQDTWTISNFNNNNKQDGWLWVKCGSKKKASIATIANSNVYSSAVTKVVVTYDTVSSKPNTTYLEVSTDPKFSTVDQKIEVKAPTKGDVAYTISSPEANAYYRLVIDNPKYKNNGQIQISKLVYYISSEPGKTITSLSFGDNADKTFWKGDTEGTTFTQTATLDPAVEGATITYSSSDENVAVVDAKGEVVVSTDKEGTATITATYAGDDTHASASASYTITVDPLYSNISELKTAKSGTNAVLRLTDAKVTYIDGGNHYLQDATGAIDVYNSGFNYNVGDVLNGIVSVTYSPFKGLPEITDFSAIGDLKVTNGDAPTPETMTIADAKKAENLCKYVVIQNVTVTPGTKSDYATAALGDESIDIYKKNQTYVGGQYDLTGIVSIHSGTPQIAFISYAPDFTIDENVNSNAITAGENGTVTIYRTFNANAWNTLVLPFDLTANQLPVKFGADAKFATYIGTSKNNDGTYTLKFESTTALTANTPVFVWGANDKELYEFSGVKVVKADPVSTPDGAAFSFTGSYDNTTLNAGDWFISSDNKFYRALGTETMKPMRAVFRPVSAAAAKGLSFSIDGGEATGISAITADGSIIVNDNAPMYNLAGQRVSDSYKGVVIKNGKKFIK